MGIKIKVKFDKNIFNTPRDEIVKSINDDLDYIGRDLLVTSRSLTPRDTGRLVNSGNLVRYKGTKASTSVSVSYLAKNPKDGFEYSTWTHNANYNLGEKSRAKMPIRSRFQKNSRGVGKGYLIDLAKDCEENWFKYMDANVDKITKKYR